MKLFKSHFFRHNKGQRNGIFFLVLLIIVLQSLFLFVDFTSDQPQAENSSERFAIQKQLEHLKLLEIEKRNAKIYPFNPNYITDHKREHLSILSTNFSR